mmetsp:Transcript_18655/g.20109  ORF Transcript_18655/g.20109 Transcript_18655/m.20109 type:complete len:81 (+) Transcript_18655:220-462(+)
MKTGNEDQDTMIRKHDNNNNNSSINEGATDDVGDTNHGSKKIGTDSCLILILLIPILYSYSQYSTIKNKSTRTIHFMFEL